MRSRVSLGRLLDIDRLKARLTPHRAPLVIVLFSAMLGQVTTLMQHPLVAPYSDTRGYLLSVQQIAGSFGFVQTFRSRGFPSFLAAVFALTGGLITIVSPVYCQQALRPVVAAQAALALLVTLWVYLLIYRLIGRRVIVCVVAAVLAVNLFVLGWERAILSEFLGYASLVAVFLFEPVRTAVVVDAAVAPAVAAAGGCWRGGGWCAAGLYVDERGRD